MVIAVAIVRVVCALRVPCSSSRHLAARLTQRSSTLTWRTIAADNGSLVFKGAVTTLTRAAPSLRPIFLKFGTIRRIDVVSFCGWSATFLQTRNPR